MLQTVYFDPFRTLHARRPVRRRDAESTLSPSVDIVKSPADYQLFVELPGVDPGTIDVTLEKRQLTVSAEKPSRQLAENESLTRNEIPGVRFQRKFTLPDDTDTNSVVADSKNGILKLVFGRKQPEQNQRKIKISA